MDVTEKEIKKFIKLFDPAYHDDVIDLIQKKNAVIIKVFMRRECDTNVYYGNYVSIVKALNNIQNGILTVKNTKPNFIRFDSQLTYVKKGIIDFVMSFISRYFENLKLIFSSSLTHIFAAPNIVIDEVNVRDATISNYACSSVHAIPNVISHRTLDFGLFAQNHLLAMFEISEDNSDFSDELWMLVLSDRENINHLVRAYLSDKYVISKKIRKRIHDTYESLPDSDKLLLELGESLDNEEDN